MLDIVSTRMLGQFGFLSSVFQARLLRLRWPLRMPLLSRAHTRPALSLPALANTVLNAHTQPPIIFNQIMAANQISVDVVATSEVSVSLTLDPAKLWSRQLIPTARRPRRKPVTL